MFLLRPLKGDIACCSGQGLSNILKANMIANFVLKMLSLLQAEAVSPENNLKFRNSD